MRVLVGIAFAAEVQEEIYTATPFSGSRRPHNPPSSQLLSGARVYFLHFDLNDWPDALAVQILAQIAAPTTPGYSKLVLGDFEHRCTVDSLWV